MAPDFTPFLSKLAVGSIVIALISIAGALAVVYVARTGAGQFLRMLYGKYEANQRDQQFQQRYAREKRNSEYRQWKKNKGKF